MIQSGTCLWFAQPLVARVTRAMLTMVKLDIATLEAAANYTT